VWNKGETPLCKLPLIAKDLNLSGLLKRGFASLSYFFPLSFEGEGD